MGVRGEKNRVVQLPAELQDPEHVFPDMDPARGAQGIVVQLQKGVVLPGGVAQGFNIRFDPVVVRVADNVDLSVFNGSQIGGGVLRHCARGIAQTVDPRDAQVQIGIDIPVHIDPACVIHNVQLRAVQQLQVVSAPGQYHQIIEKAVADQLLLVRAMLRYAVKSESFFQRRGGHFAHRPVGMAAGNGMGMYIQLCFHRFPPVSCIGPGVKATEAESRLSHAPGDDLRPISY